MKERFKLYKGTFKRQSCSIILIKKKDLKKKEKKKNLPCTLNLNCRAKYILLLNFTLNLIGPRPIWVARKILYKYPCVLKLHCLMSIGIFSQCCIS